MKGIEREHPERRKDEKTGKYIEFFVKNIYTSPVHLFEQEIRRIEKELPANKIRVGLKAYRDDTYKEEVRGMRPVFASPKDIITQN